MKHNQIILSKMLGINLVSYKNIVIYLNNKYVGIRIKIVYVSQSSSYFYRVNFVKTYFLLILKKKCYGSSQSTYCIGQKRDNHLSNRLQKTGCFLIVLFIRAKSELTILL